MFDWIRRHTLQFLRVPPAPEPPLGAPGSVRVFRAGQNFYKLRLFRWGFGQLGALVGIGFSLSFLYVFKESIGPVESGLRQGLPQETAAKIAPANPGADPAAPAPTAVKQDARRVRRVNSLQRVAQSSGWLIPLIEVVEVLGILFFLVQLPVTLAAVRLEFELHWYIVTDRSLRIRSGLLRLQESTMSFANLQQVEVKQGPLQRWLGLADVRVQSAGGGGGQSPHGQTDDSLHTGVFHSVDNASEIRDLILERLRRFRMAGLGDPEDHHAVIVGGVPPPGGISAPDATVLAAAHELLAEARALRAALS